MERWPEGELYTNSWVTSGLVGILVAQESRKRFADESLRVGDIICNSSP